MARVPFINKVDLPLDKQFLYDQIAAHRGHVATPFAALLNSPDVAARVASVGEQLRYISGSITSEIREIVTLTTANSFKCHYIWTHHCKSAKQAGVRDEVVEAIKKGGRPRGLRPKESVFVQFTKELLEEQQIRDATYGAVEHLLGSGTVVDLVVTIGYYSMLCLTINALDINIEEEVVPDV